MRTLSKRQMKFLGTLFLKGVTNTDEMSSTDWRKLEAMNDHETLWLNTNRYLMDLFLEQQRLSDPWQLL